MPILVQKYGGSSVADIDKIKAIALKLKSRREQGYDLVVIVSAMAGTTDALLRLAHEVTAAPKKRELDMLLTTGERTTMALLSMALNDLGIPAISFTGSQSGIITNDSHINARIIEVRPYRVRDELERGKVVIIAGFQGVSYKREVTTLGRGGSDTTAVAMAAALGAECCEIYSDVDGVFSGDPRIVEQARKLREIDYEEMQELAECGAKVLNAQAVEFARKANIPIDALSTFTSGSGTRVTQLGLEGARHIAGVTGQKNLVRLALTPASPEAIQVLLSLLAERDVEPLDPTSNGGRFSLLVSLDNVHAFGALEESLRSRLGDILRVETGLGRLSIVGQGLGADSSCLSRVLAILAVERIEIDALHVEKHRISAVIAMEALGQAIRAVHHGIVEAITNRPSPDRK
ncbi:MAG: aspartate kinase [Myxococcales bacterium]|nr:aspartate kinase [Myxococcales bacterium]